MHATHKAQKKKPCATFCDNMRPLADFSVKGSYALSLRERTEQRGG